MGYGAKAALAKEWDVQKSVITRFLKGDIPNITLPNISKMLDGLGLQVVPASMVSRRDDSDLPTAPLCGSVAGGALRWGDSLGAAKRIPVATTQWENNRFWKQTKEIDKRIGNWRIQENLILLQVHGDSMEPEYPDGCLVACRQPKNEGDIRDNTPCIFRESSRGYTFKLMRWDRPEDKPGRRCVGIPINPKAYPIIFDEDADVYVDFIVVGKIVDVGKLL